VVLDEHGHGHKTGLGRRQIGTRGRMREQLRDNLGHAVSQRITAAGFTVEPTRRMALRIGGKVGIELARPNRQPQKEPDIRQTVPKMTNTPRTRPRTPVYKST
jgi:hypothetical protein